MGKAAIPIEPNMSIAGVAVFAIVISLMLAAMLPVMGVGVTGDTDADSVAEQKMALSRFNGQSILNTAPFELKGVYLQYVPGQTVNEDENFTPDGWLYGTSVDNYQYIGEVAQIRFDPNQKADNILQPTNDTVTYLKTYDYWWSHDYQKDQGTPGWIRNVQSFFQGIGHALNVDLGGMPETYKEWTTEQANYWQYQGYRYYFEPVVKVEVDENDDEQKITTKNMSLSVVWYKMVNTEGISGGLVIYNEAKKTVVQNITMEEIIGNYNTTSGYASNYDMNFDGVPITFSIRFDQRVLDGEVPMVEAFQQGMWTCAFSTNSVSSLIEENGTFTLNAGNTLKTYTEILTVSYPGLASPWNIIVWLLCTIPLTVLTLEVVLKFLAILVPSWA